MMKATQKFDGVTWVVWLIEKCPVPPGFDPRLVGPCIKRYLERLGYSGPLTITALGVLKDIPVEVLRAVSSSGIGLQMDDTYGSGSVMLHVYNWTIANPAPANLMVITDPEHYDSLIELDVLEFKKGYDIIYPYSDSECPWEDFLLTESPALEDDNCIQTGESVWVCSVCDSHNVHTGFENFTKHISSEEHEHKSAPFIPGDENLWSTWTPPTASEFALAWPQPKCQCFLLDPHMSATPSESHGKDDPEPKKRKRRRRRRRRRRKVHQHVLFSGISYGVLLLAALVVFLIMFKSRFILFL